jgi:serine/threonine-protein kinase RsbW
VPRIRVPATAESLAVVTSLLDDLAVTAALPQPARHAMRLAFEELLVNVAAHGAGTGSHVDVEGAVEDDRVWIRLTDTGPPFDPGLAPAPDDLDQPLERRRIGGLGLYLTRRMVDELEYRRVDGQNETTLVMRRR